MYRGASRADDVPRPKSQLCQSLPRLWESRNSGTAAGAVVCTQSTGALACGHGFAFSSPPHSLLTRPFLVGHTSLVSKELTSYWLIYSHFTTQQRKGGIFATASTASSYLECRHSARIRNWNVSFPVLPDSCNVLSVYYWMQSILLNTLSMTFSEKSLAKFCKSFSILRPTLLLIIEQTLGNLV